MERTELRKIQTINDFARRHSYHGDLLSMPENFTPTAEEEGNYDTPFQDAREWNRDHYPEFVNVEEEIDDGDNHDVSRVMHYIADTEQGDIHIFSYNNNAWGHCDIFESYETPEDIANWLSHWDEIPEEWLKDYVNEPTRGLRPP